MLNTVLHVHACMLDMCEWVLGVCGWVLNIWMPRWGLLSLLCRCGWGSHHQHGWGSSSSTWVGIVVIVVLMWVGIVVVVVLMWVGITSSMQVGMVIIIVWMWVGMVVDDVSM